MTLKHSALAQAKLKELLHYDRETGVFTWAGHRCSTLNGKVAGCSSCGSIKGLYWIIRIAKKVYLAHRLAWLYEYGYMPDTVDHVNGNGKDNRLSNLRECVQQQNIHNSSKQNNNTSGVLGVSFCKSRNKWRAYLTMNGKQYSGYFASFDDAVSFRRELAQTHYGKFAYEARNDCR